MSRRLDWSKLKISDKVISMEEALKDIEPWIDFSVPKLITCCCPVCKKEFKEELMLSDFPKYRNENGSYILYCEECFN